MVPVLLGTTREGRKSMFIAIAAQQALVRRGAESFVLDLVEHPLPVLVERRRRLDPVPATVEDVGQILENAEALMIVTPEYNWGVPGPLKNALDHFGPELAKKPVGIVTVSAGPGGGRLALAALLPTMASFGALVVPKFAMVGSVDDKLDSSGGLTDGRTLSAIDGVAGELLWWLEASRLKREQDRTASPDTHKPTA
jgi:NAD(P)H-dependent FMN reductase